MSDPLPDRALRAVPDRARQLLGQRVKIKLDDHYWLTGRLLSVDDDGSAKLDCEGITYYCWPLLAIKAAP